MGMERGADVRPRPTRRPGVVTSRRRATGLLVACVSFGALLGCSDDSNDSAVFGPASTLPPARTVPAEARDFCGLADDLLAVGDVFQQLEEPLQRLVEQDFAGAVEPMGQLYDAVDQGLGVLDSVVSSAPASIAPDVERAVGGLIEALGTLPSRDRMITALEAGDGPEISRLLADFEAAISQAGAADAERSAATERMQEYVSATC
jgi:hypothetical protein